MTPKAELLQAIDDMPDDASYDQIVQRITFVANVNKGVAQAARDEGTQVQEVMKQIPNWLLRKSSDGKGEGI
jgi:hypothetical protein